MLMSDHMFKLGHFENIAKASRNLSPVTLAFCLSLMLSAIAYGNDPVINKDGILYIDTARIFLEEGFTKTIKHFDWPWFSVLIGASGWLTGLSFDLWARIWCALFMAGTCSLVVACVQARLPKAGHWACLVVLAMPAFNQFRGEVLREFGFWFFCILALWLAQRWQLRQSWLTAAFIHLAVLAAVAFRLEALVLVPALGLWQGVVSARQREWRGFIQINALPFMALVLAAGLALSSDGAMHSRIVRYWGLISPEAVFAKFSKVSGRFGTEILGRFSRDEAGQILFFGFLITILLKFARMLGPFCVPLFFRKAWPEVKQYYRDFQPFFWVWLLYLVVLVLFFVRRQYIISRWVSFLDLLVVPLVVLWMIWLIDNFPRLTKFLVAVSCVVMIANVVSLSPKKTHYIDAGKWLSANVRSGESIYYDDPRISYYAGRGFPRKQLKREAALSLENADKYRYFVLEAREDDPSFQQWLQQQHKRVLADFANKKGKTVLVIGE